MLYHLGRPGEVKRLGWIGGQVWSWRYPTFDCLWFQVTVNDDGSLRDAGGYGIDPSCDAPSDRVGRRRRASSSEFRSSLRPRNSKRLSMRQRRGPSVANLR
jgi:hypothetical protein